MHAPNPAELPPNKVPLRRRACGPPESDATPRPQVQRLSFDSLNLRFVALDAFKRLQARGRRARVMADAPPVTEAAQVLRLRGNKLANLDGTGIAGMRHLHVLDLRDNMLADLKPVRGSPRRARRRAARGLTWMSARGQIVEIVNKLQRLEFLGLLGNPLAKEVERF
jgi:hypothetical protein